MKLRQIVLWRGPQMALDRPFTVLHGLSADVRAEILEGLGALSEGTDAGGLGGLVELGSGEVVELGDERVAAALAGRRLVLRRDDLIDDEELTRLAPAREGRSTAGAEPADGPRHSDPEPAEEPPSTGRAALPPRPPRLDEPLPPEPELSLPALPSRPGILDAPVPPVAPEPAGALPRPAILDAPGPPDPPPVWAFEPSPRPPILDALPPEVPPHPGPPPVAPPMLADLGPLHPGPPPAAVEPDEAEAPPSPGPLPSPPAPPAALSAPEPQVVAPPVEVGDGGDGGDDEEGAPDPGLVRLAAVLAEEEADREAILAQLEAEAAAVVVPVQHDREPVVRALAAARRALEADPEEERERATRLAAEWDELEERRDRLPAGTAPSWLVRSAREALAEAQARVDSLRGDAASGDGLDMALVAELEVAHTTVMGLEARVSRTNLAARRQLAQARRAEEDLLGRLGLSSYDSLALRIATEQRASVARRRLDKAEERLRDAKAMWGTLRPPDDDPSVVALLEEEEELRQRVVALLGYEPEPDPRLELRSWMPVVPSPTTAAHDLRQALLAVGCGSEPDADLSRLVGLAASWLAAAEEQAQPVADLMAMKAAILADVQRAQADLEHTRRRRAQTLQAIEEAAADSQAAAARSRAAAQREHERLVAEHERSIAEHEAWARARADAERQWAAAQVAHAVAVAQHEAALAAAEERARRQAERQAEHEAAIEAHAAAVAAFDDWTARRAAAAEAHDAAVARWRAALDAHEAAVAARTAHDEGVAAERAAWERENAAAEEAHAAAVAAAEAAATERQMFEEERAAASAAHAAAVAAAAREHAATVEARRAHEQLVAQATASFAGAMRAWEAEVARLRAEHAAALEARQAAIEERTEVEAAWRSAVEAAEQATAAQAAAAQAAEAEAEERRLLLTTALEAVLLGRLANFCKGGDEAVPVVVDDALRGLPEQVAVPLFDLLVRSSHALQVVYLTDDEALIDRAGAAAGRWSAGTGAVA